MNIKKKTAIFTIGSIVLFFLAWIIFDIYVIEIGGTEASISFFMYETAMQNPIFPFVCGTLFGGLATHFFWRIRDTKRTKQLSDAARL